MRNEGESAEGAGTWGREDRATGSLLGAELVNRNIKDTFRNHQKLSYAGRWGLKSFT